MHTVHVDVSDGCKLVVLNEYARDFHLSYPGQVFTIGMKSFEATHTLTMMIEEKRLCLIRVL